MSIVDTVIRTVTCNGPECLNTATFEQKDHAATVEANPWFKTLRIIQTTDGRTFVYCSDICEVGGVTSGAHNPPEPKKVIETPTGAAADAIRRAALSAQEAEKATKALKEGRPVQLHKA